MSQEMNILSCFSCKMYQVHIVKKAKKWQCKVCNAKQSLKRVYFQGSGKDCRIEVQKLNAMKEHDNQTNASFVTGNDMHYDSCHNNYTEQPRLEVAENKWAKYLNTSEEIRFNDFESSNNDNNSDKENDNSVYLDDDNMTQECSQNDYINSNFYHKDDPQQNLYCDNGRKCDNIINEECNDCDSKKDNFHESITEAKDAKNIFDDNEEFDLAIDF